MALNMDAAVKIKASVDGLQEISSLERSLKGVEGQASRTAGVMGRMRGAASGLSGALGSILPAVGVAGIAALGKQAIDAADNLNDLSQRVGVAVPTLSKFGAAAEDSGSSIEEVAKAMGRLSKGIVDPASKANEALKSIGISSTDASGKVRTVDAIMLDLADKFAKMPDGAAKTALAMDLFGKSGMNLIPMLNGGRDALSQYAATIDTEMAQAADQFNDALNAVARSLAGPFNQAVTALLPLITQMANAIAGLAEAFAKLPAPVQGFVAGIAALAAAFVVLAPVITAVVSAVTALGPVIAGISGALSGLGAVLAGVFSGPVGWVALAIAAGAAIYAFRDNIADAFRTIGFALTEAAKAFKTAFIDPVTGFLDGMWRNIKEMFGRLAEALAAPFKVVAETIRGVVNSIIGGIQTAINGAISGINRLISQANRALSVVRLPQIPEVSTVSLPRFADGGVVSRPTLAMVGEGGEPEYIVPQSKAGAFAANWMAGRRGAAAIPATTGGGTAQINITTGPVLQQNGARYVTMSDMEQALQTMADTLLGSVRSAGGRRYVGLA
jgi:TP901 family phage tail tape measure protein